MLLGISSIPAGADGNVIVGEVTVTSMNYVNIRSGGSTDYPIIAKGKPGELFKTTGILSGWYEILLPDNTYGYINDGLVYYYPYPSPVVIGGQYTIPVYYMTPQGQTLKTFNVTVKTGQNIITADDSQAPGYRLVSTRSVYVYVNTAGTAVPNGVIFSYESAYSQPTAAPNVNATIPVYYRDVYNQIIASEYRVLSPGTQLLRADQGKLPQGYYVSGASDAVVNVYSNGTATPSGVTFIVSRLVSQTPQPVSFSVPVSYRDEQGNVLFSTSQTIQAGYATVTANDSYVPSGMQLTSSRSVVVYTTSQGVSFPSTVVFTYRSSFSANIQVIYRDTQNRSLYTETRQLSQGTHTITADDSRVPSGYVLQNTRSVQVTVYSNGTVSQNQIVFVYAMPVSANLNIEYRDNDGRTLYSQQQTLSQGTHTITADNSKVPSGYVLQNERNVQVTVYSNGILSTDRVVYLYSRAVSASISVFYVDNYGSTLYSERLTFQQGTFNVTADDGRVPSGYNLQGERNVQVTVNSSGSISPSQVIFTYTSQAPQEPPVTINIPLIYIDQNGALLHQTSVSASSYSPQLFNADMSLVPPGYVLSGPSSITVTVSPSGVATPVQVVFTFRSSETISETILLPGHQEFSYSGGSIPVFSGPGTHYYRAASGKAAIGGGRIRVWGTQGDWAMIGYGLSNNLYRVGYIQKSALPANLTVPELYFANKTATVVSEASLTDDPIINPTWLMKIPVGTKVTLLAYENFITPPHWAYIETTFNGQPIRGFINRIRIQED